MQSHYLHLCLLSINGILRNKLQWNFYQNTATFIQETDWNYQLQSVAHSVLASFCWYKPPSRTTEVLSCRGIRLVGNILYSVFELSDNFSSLGVKRLSVRLVLCVSNWTHQPLIIWRFKLNLGPLQTHLIKQCSFCHWTKSRYREHFK